MLGAAIVNSSNQIVQSFGNTAFKLHLQCDSAQTPIELPSPSTSGISSASTTSLNKNLAKQVLDKEIKIDDSILLQTILPMIVLYRTQKTPAQHIDTISSKIKFSFHELDNSHLLIILAQESYSDAQLKKFSTDIKYLFKCQYGVFIHFLKADLPSIRKSKARVEKKMTKIIYQNENFTSKHDIFNVNSMFSNIENYAELQPIFQQVSMDIQKNIGNCRCLFINSGQLIGSTCSHSKDNTPIFELVDPQDFSSVFELGQCPTDNKNNGGNNGNGKLALKCQAEQAWLTYPLYKKCQLVNIFTFSISNTMDIICLCSIEQSTLIHTLCDLLEILENFESENELNEKVDKIEDLVQRTSKLLLEFKMSGIAKNGDFCNFVFLSSPTRTEKLLTGLWHRLFKELQRFSNPNKTPSPSIFSTPAVSRRQSLQSKINRWGSSFSVGSSISGSLSIFPKFKSPTSLAGSIRIRGGFPVQICALISHFQRHIRSVLNEFCIYSQNLGKIEKFEKFMEVVKKSMDKTKTWKMQMIIANVMNNEVLGDPLKPVALGLDMLAFKFERLDGPLNFQYVPDPYKEVFSYIDTNASKTNEISVIRLKTGEFLIQLTGSKPKIADTNKILKLVQPLNPMPKKSMEEIPTLELPIKISVIFPSTTNMNLAIKQSNQLSLLNFPLKNAYKLFK